MTAKGFTKQPDRWTTSGERERLKRKRKKRNGKQIKLGDND